MKCSECDGVGYKKISATSCAICERCGGTGEVGEAKETNFDRITKTPEALAEFINKAERIYERCCNDGDVRCDFCECQWCGIAGRSELVEWLKQPHREIGK